MEPAEQGLTGVTDDSKLPGPGPDALDDETDSDAEGSIETDTTFHSSNVLPKNSHFGPPASAPHDSAVAGTVGGAEITITDGLDVHDWRGGTAEAGIPISPQQRSSLSSKSKRSRDVPKRVTWSRELTSSTTFDLRDPVSQVPVDPY